MYSIQNYVNPYDKMPPPPERFVIGPFIFEEVPVRDGNIVLPKGIENIFPQEDIVEFKPKKIKSPKNTNIINSLAKNTNISKFLRAVKSVLFIG